MTPTPEQVATAGRILARARATRDSLPVAEAARLAYVPGGPSMEELAERIRARRASTATPPVRGTPAA